MHYRSAKHSHTRARTYPWYCRETGAIDQCMLATHITGLVFETVPAWLAALELPERLDEPSLPELARIDALVAKAWRHGSFDG